MRLPSVDMDELMKLDAGALREATDWALSFSFSPSLDIPDSPTGILDSLTLPPAVALPSVPRDNTFASSDGSGEGSGAAHDDDGSPTAGAAPAGGRRKKPAPAEAKERVRAKNRRAQNKYREKQKAARAETEVALDQAVADVERLRLENARLGLSNQVMEKVLDVRETTVSLLEQSREEIASDSALPGTYSALKPTAPLPRYLEDCSEQAGAESGCVQGTCPLESMSQSEIAVLQKKPPAEVKRFYEGLVFKLRDALQEVTDARSAGRPLETAETAMKEVLWQAGCMCFETAVTHPQAMQKLLAASVEDGTAAPDAADHARAWEEITRSLELTVDQRRRLQPIREVFVQRISRVKTRRAAALQGLQGVGAPAPTDGSLRALQAATAQWVRLNETSQDLAASQQEEHVACMELVAKAFGGVLTPLQKAKAIVAAYDAYKQFPDAFAIATAAGKGLDVLEDA